VPAACTTKRHPESVGEGAGSTQPTQKKTHNMNATAESRIPKPATVFSYHGPRTSVETQSFVVKLHRTCSICRQS
jgi:hypothetical protein